MLGTSVSATRACPCTAAGGKSRIILVRLYSEESVSGV